MKRPAPPPVAVHADDLSLVRALQGCAMHLVTHVREHSGAWIVYLAVHFGGGVYEYLIEAGDASISREEVDRRMLRNDVVANIFRRFLSEVELEIAH